jgi:hypothetical protein
VLACRYGILGDRSLTPPLMNFFSADFRFDIFFGVLELIVPNKVSVARSSEHHVTLSILIILITRKWIALFSDRRKLNQ